MRYLKVKRFMDLLCSFLGMVILSPLFLIIVIVIKVDSDGPVLFRQKRVGIHKNYFYILKFRTMKIDAPNEIPTHLLHNPELYITKIGKFLRKTSLDELPQIWNIFIGQMSMIGPRPVLWNEYDLIEEREKYGANDILPGLTGLAQINGRDIISNIDKARLDGEYVEKLNPWLDIKCFLGTIVQVIKSDGVIEGGNEIIYSQQEAAATNEMIIE